MPIQVIEGVNFREEIESKARGLFEYGGWKDQKGQDRLIKMIWEIEEARVVKLKN